MDWESNFFHMDVFTKKDLLNILENIDDDTPIGVKVNEFMAFDLEFGIADTTGDSDYDEILYVSSDLLDDLMDK